ncbi:MAG TPA: L,D-transpeptidase family protein [Longimicrobium sp.]|nr:L,D-transpeptidase family protein [Longimicrobium sp.]
MIVNRYLSAALAALLLAACGGDADEAEKAPEPRAQAPASPNAVRVSWDRRAPRFTQAQLDSMRQDMSWMELVQLDTTGSGAPARPNPEKWEDINPQNVNSGGQFVPLTGDVAGPSVLRAQILLDRALFSPGIMDGRWGKNTVQALYWFQRREGLPATARLDSATFERLRRAAGNPRELVVRRTLTAEDVKGPFTTIPEDIYEHARLSCSCYESLSEKLSEDYHATPELLEKLNPGVDLDNLQAGESIHVPAVRDETRAGSRGQVAKIVVSGRGNYVHAVDAAGKVLYHFPSTLGGKYSPSPSGRFSINAVTHDPAWHYQPDILVGVPDNEPEAMIPAGPNVAVGKVWIDLSEPHFGIHGTSEPQTIGYASSNGCVRLTNWDVEFLSHHVRQGIPVEFRDISGQKQAEDPANAEAAAATAGGRAASATPPGNGSAGGRSSSAATTRGGSEGSGARSSSSSTSGSESRGRTRTEPAQPKQDETPKSAEPAKQEDHAGHEPRR